MPDDRAPEDQPEWMTDVMTEVAKPHAVAADYWRSFREWFGLAIAGLIAWLVASGLASMNEIERKVDWTANFQIETKSALDRHIESANAANLALSRILSRIESRTSRLEGLEEGRTHGRDGG